MQEFVEKGFDDPVEKYLPELKPSRAITLRDILTHTSKVLSRNSFGHGGAYSTQSWADPTKNLI